MCVLWLWVDIVLNTLDAVIGAQCVCVCVHNPHHLTAGEKHQGQCLPEPSYRLQSPPVKNTTTRKHNFTPDEESIVIWKALIKTSLHRRALSKNIHAFITTNFLSQHQWKLLKLLICGCEPSSRTKRSDPWLREVHTPSAISGQFCWSPTHQLYSLQHEQMQMMMCYCGPFMS